MCEILCLIKVLIKYYLYGEETLEEGHVTKELGIHS